MHGRTNCHAQGVIPESGYNYNHISDRGNTGSSIAEIIAAIAEIMRKCDSGELSGPVCEKNENKIPAFTSKDENKKPADWWFN